MAVYNEYDLKDGRICGLINITSLNSPELIEEESTNRRSSNGKHSHVSDGGDGDANASMAHGLANLFSNSQVFIVI